MSVITVGILTVSDSCYAKQKDDISGRKLYEHVTKTFPNYKIIEQTIISDEKSMIKSILNQWISNGYNLILTTGGTGFGPRDQTPEATRDIIEREAPGLSYAMIMTSLKITPMAVLSRPVCGIKQKSIIINLPGSPKGAIECLTSIQSALPHALDLVVGNDGKIVETHQKVQSVIETNPSSISTIPIVNRLRQSPFPMISVKEAKQLIFDKTLRRIDEINETIPIEFSLGRILSEDIYSIEPVPPFNASIKDGYAVLTSDGIKPRRVVNFCAAGGDFIETPLKPGEAVRICTGAPIPPGTDAVIQVEDTELNKTTQDGCEELEILVKKTPKFMQDIRKIGTDIEANVKIFNVGQMITSGHIGVLATIGRSTIKVFKKPLIGVLSTGNELIDYRDVPQKLGQIRDSNRLTLKNLLKEYRYDCQDFGIIRDTPDDVKTKIAQALNECDVVITSGGVSMGEFDLIKQILINDFNACIHFGRINMKPGKPTTFATLEFNGKQKIFFGLPGNPVSAGVTCLLFVVPLLKYLEYYENPEFPTITGILNQTVVNKDERSEYVRVRVKQIENEIQIFTTGDQISSRLNSLAGSNGLLLIPGSTTLTQRSFQNVLLFNQIFTF